MIIGFGSDLCDIRRIEDLLSRFADRFTKRCFTDIERQKSDGRAARAASYAKRFAAKEACSKALGTGMRFGVAWREMGVVNLPSGRPTLRLTGGALRRLEALTPRGCRAALHLTITDEYPWAQALVIIEALEGADALLQPPRSDIYEAWTHLAESRSLQLLEPLGGAPCTVVSAHDKERFLGPAAVIESLDAGALGGSAIGFSPALELKPRNCSTIAEKLRELA